MSGRKSPPPKINTQAPSDKGKGRARSRPPTRTPSHTGHGGAKDGGDEHEDDDAPPTSTLRARNVTGVSILDFPLSPGTPKSATSSGGGSASGVPGAWKLPGIKGTRGGISSPGRGSPVSWSSATWATGKNDDDAKPPQRSPISFRTDPTIQSCLDTLPLESKDEIRRLFGLS